jgi:hypothetical protein
VSGGAGEAVTAPPGDVGQIMDTTTTANTPGRPGGGGDSRPPSGALAQVAASGLVVAALLAWVTLRAVATALSDACGEDVSWLVQAAATLVAAAGTVVGAGAVFAWWLRSRPPRGGPWWTRAVVAVAGACLAVCVVAELWLPDGACAAGG